MSENEHKKLDEKELDDLVINCQDGDSHAFGKLYDLLIDQIYRYIYFRVSAEEAEDLTEVVFLKVFTNIKKYKKGKFSFLSWIYRIAHNLVVDHYRVHRSISELKIDVPEVRKDRDPRYKTENTLSKEVLKAALAKLNKNYQQMIVLKFINGLNNEEIALVMKKRRGSIRILQFRALAALKKELSNMGVNGQ